MWGSLLVMDRGRKRERRRKEGQMEERTNIHHGCKYIQERRGEERRGKEEELSQRKVQARG